MADHLPSERSLVEPGPTLAGRSAEWTGLAEPPVRLLHAGRNRTKARVWLVGAPPRAVVVKDFSAAPTWFRWPARRLLAREARAYEALEGLKGVPKLVFFDERDTLVLSRIEGTPLPRLTGGKLDETLFERLAALLREIHRRGVACGDLHHRNVIVDGSGYPHIVDFAMAAVRPRRPRAGRLSPREWIFRRLSELDDSALVRMRLRYLRRAATEQERVILRRGSGLWRVGRALKRAIASVRPGKVKAAGGEDPECGGGP
jgi:predicted Ser/Thr protein kinase